MTYVRGSDAISRGGRLRHSTFEAPKRLHFCFLNL